jgi:3-oxoacyl-[acyl-carrier protein] reductase
MKYFSLLLLFLSPLVYSQKTYVITCATGQLGNAICEKLARDGHNLILIGRSEKKLKTLAHHLSDSSKKHKFIAVDFLDKEKIKRLNFETLPKIDGIVLITPRPQFIHPLPNNDQWQQMFEMCFTTPLEILKKCIPNFSEQASVVILSGTTSVESMPEYASYGVLRTMWLGEAKSLTYYLGPKGIRVNTFSPGVVSTKHHLKQLQDKAEKLNISFSEVMQKKTQNIPLQCLPSPQDVANGITFLLSDESRLISGANLTCDGGATKAY